MRETVPLPPPETPRVAGVDRETQGSTQEGEGEAEQEEEDSNEGVVHEVLLKERSNTIPIFSNPINSSFVSVCCTHSSGVG